jgi:hypothetical protein
MLALAIPAWHGYKLVYIYVLSEIIASKDIVEAQGAIAEIIAESLCERC